MHFRSVNDPKPCAFDPQILPQLILQEQQAKETNQNKPYQLVAAGQKDWQTVETLYNLSSVPGYDIGKIEVIVNETFSQGFYAMLKIFEERSQQPVFAPTWHLKPRFGQDFFLGAISDEEKDMREQVHNDLNSLAKIPEHFHRVKVIPMFHGTKQDVLASIFSGNIAALSTTDEGFFGKGIYHSSFAHYSYKYAQHNPPGKTPREGALLMNWVCFSSAYPVIHHPDVRDNAHWETVGNPLKKLHWKHLFNRPGPIEGKYDAHYVLVAPRNPHNPHEMDFFPCKKGETHTYNELVTFFPGQVLPRYLVTLTPDIAHTTTLAPTFTTSHIKIALQELTTQIQTGPLAEALIYRLKTIEEGRSLSHEELIELGHLLYLTQTQTHKQTQESTQFLLEKITLERVRKRNSSILTARWKQPLPFPFFFEEVNQLPTLLILADGNPFQAVEVSIRQEHFDQAINELLFILSLDVDSSQCYHYLYLLLPHIENLDPLFNRLPSLFKRSSNSDRAQFALQLSYWYEKRKAYAQAIYCTAKAIEFQGNKSFDRTSQLFTELIFLSLKQMMQKPSFLALTAEEYEKTLQSLTRFFLNQEQMKPLLAFAREKLNGLPSNEQQKYLAFQEKILKSSKPFLTPPITEKYTRAFQFFLDHFSQEPKQIRAFQIEGMKKLRSFFEVLLEDAFILLGPPPCAYDIRAMGTVGREEIFPSLELECALLVERADPYFSSLQEILNAQFLTLGKRTHWLIIDAKTDFLPSLIESVTLAQNNSKLYTQYREACTKLQIILPQFHCPSRPQIREICFSDLKKYYLEPLHQFLGQLALHHKIDKTNPLEIVESLTEETFSKETKILLQDCLASLYQMALSLFKKNQLSFEEQDLLQRCEWLVLSPLSSHQPYKNLELIARVDGSLGHYHIGKLHRLLEQWIIPGESDVKITGAVSGYLHPDVKIFDSEGNIRSTYKDSAHRVCPFKGLHFKQKPSHPLMEYAIYHLFCRCAGLLTPPNVLVRFDIGKKSYPVLISQTIPGAHPTPGQHLDPKQWTQMLLCSILTRPGDGRFSNYVVNNQKIYCIDNDVSFVEPVVSNSPFSRTVQFCSALFFMKPLDTPLDPEALKQFLLLDRSTILNGWIEDLIQKEKEYTTLFSEKEREQLYNEDKNLSFTPTILFKQGALATLDLQFWKLQNLIQREKNLTAGDLLKALISLEESVGSYVHKSYLKSKTLQQAVGRKDHSLTSIEYSKASLGKIPSHAEIEDKKLYSPEKARDEFFSSLLMRSSDFAEVTFHPGQTTFSAHFQHLENDPAREILVLKALGQQAVALKPKKVILNHSTQLSSILLIPFLHSELTHLDLRHCPLIDDDALSLIHTASGKLEQLFLSATNIRAFCGGVFSRILEFPQLKQLQIDRCPNLHTIQIRALKLQTCTAKYNPKLQLFQIKRSPLFQVDYSGSPQVQLTHLQMECTRTLQGHTEGVRALVQLMDGTLASGSEDDTIKLWDPLSGICKQTLKGHTSWADTNSVHALIQLADGTLASGGDYTIKLWDLLSGDFVQTLNGHTSEVSALVQLTDGTLVSGSNDDTIKLWDPLTGSLKQTLKGHLNSVYALIQLADGTLASGSADNTIKLWDPPSGSLKQTLNGHTRVITLVQLADGTLASGSADNTIKLWDPLSGFLKQTLNGHTKRVVTLVQLADGTLASGSADNTIKLWDPLSGTLKQTLKGHTNGVGALIQLADGTLASGSYDNTIKLWQ